MRASRAARIDERADAVREACCRAYAQLSTEDLSHTVLPGVRELLDWLSARDDVMLGLLTGNYEAGRAAEAREGRASAATSRPAQGAFGSDAEDRAALPAIARRRAGAVGKPYPRALTIVIGDTPRDIACAQRGRRAVHRGDDRPVHGRGAGGGRTSSCSDAAELQARSRSSGHLTPSLEPGGVRSLNRGRPEHYGFGVGNCERMIRSHDAVRREPPLVDHQVGARA